MEFSVGTTDQCGPRTPVFTNFGMFVRRCLVDSLDWGYRKVSTYAGQHIHWKNADMHPCLEWNSNPRSKCLSGRT
jgi:hypothetical protein